MNNGFGQLWEWERTASSVMEWLSLGVLKALSLSLSLSLSLLVGQKKNYHPVLES